MIPRKHLAQIYRLLAPTWLPVRYVVDRLSAATGGRPHPDPARVLIVKTDAIGDFVLWLSSAAVLRRLYPPERFHLTLLCNQACEELAALSGLFDRVQTIAPARFNRRPLYRWKTLRMLRRGRFGLVLHPTCSRTFDTDALVAAAGAAERIGFVTDLCNLTAWSRRVGDRQYTRLIRPDPEPGRPTMELRRYARFARELGGGEVQAVGPCFSAPTEGRLPVLADAKLVEPYFVLFGGASAAYRAYPPAGWGRIARETAALTGWRGVVCGGPGDVRAAQAIVQAADPLSLLNLSGRTTLMDLLAVLARARLVVSAETSAVHLAAAVGTPCVCILGGGHYGRFVPYDVDDAEMRPLPLPVIHRMDCYNCNWECIFRLPRGAPAPCVGRIEPEQVLATVKAALAGRAP